MLIKIFISGFRDVYRLDLKKDVAVSKQSYTLFLGGLQKEYLDCELETRDTMAQFAKKVGVKYLGFLIEYCLDDDEDLKIVSLLLQPGEETKYVCQCLLDDNKMPLHIFRGNTAFSLTRLSEICPCNINFRLYTKR